jgi:hypothetical protein
LPIFDWRLPILPPWLADGPWKEVPRHFFNRQSPIGNENLVFGCGYATLRTWPSQLSFTSEIVRAYNVKFGLRVQGLAVAPQAGGWVEHSAFDQLERGKMHGTKPRSIKR